MITADSVLFELETLTYKEVVSIKDEKTALSCCAALINCLHLNFKNRMMYIPSTNKHHLDSIYSMIYNDFDGHNYKELAIKYGRSEQNIYAITKRERNNYIKKNHHDLFPDDTNKVHIKKPVTLFIIEESLPSELIQCGLLDDQAKDISNKIAVHLCATFPGVSIYISEAIKNKRSNMNQTSIF